MTNKFDPRWCSRTNQMVSSANCRESSGNTSFRGWVVCSDCGRRFENVAISRSFQARLPRHYRQKAS